MDNIPQIIIALAVALAAILAIAAILMPIVVIGINGKLSKANRSLAAMERMMRTAETRANARR